VKFGYPKSKSKELIDAIRGNIANKQTADETLKRVQMLVA
jgi:hypothetical protein